jgi:hypothetical protein
MPASKRSSLFSLVATVATSNLTYGDYRKYITQENQRFHSLLPLPDNSEQICFSNSPKENKKFESEKLNFDISLFWRLENFANLNDCNAVEIDDQFRSFCEDIT